MLIIIEIISIGGVIKFLVSWILCRSCLSFNLSTSELDVGDVRRKKIFLVLKALFLLISFVVLFKDEYFAIVSNFRLFYLL